MDEQKIEVIFFIVFLLLSIVLAIVSVIFEAVLLYVFFGLALAGTFFLGYLLTRENTKSLTVLLECHKLKEQLLVQKTELQKQYLKRKISEKQFKTQANSLDKKIFFIDYKIKYFDDQLQRTQDLNRTMEFLQKKYFKQEISEDLYNDIQIELSKELAKDFAQKQTK